MKHRCPLPFLPREGGMCTNFLWHYVEHMINGRCKTWQLYEAMWCDVCQPQCPKITRWYVVMIYFAWRAHYSRYLACLNGYWFAYIPVDLDVKYNPRMSGSRIKISHGHRKYPSSTLVYEFWILATEWTSASKRAWHFKSTILFCYIKAESTSKNCDISRRTLDMCRSEFLNSNPGPAKEPGPARGILYRGWCFSWNVWSWRWLPSGEKNVAMENS